MYLGSNINRVRGGYGINWVNETKVLGIYFSNFNSASQNEKNWKDRLAKLKRIIKTWEKRNLGLLGKICVIKSFLASQFIHVMKAFVLPDNILTEINTILFRFLWRKRDCNTRAFEKVKRKVLINDYEKRWPKYGRYEVFTTIFSVRVGS